MATHHCFTIVAFFLGILSIVRTISVPYEDIQLAFPATTRLIYTASESDPDFNGYSYATQDFSGGESNVVFATGTDSVTKLQKAMNSIHGSDAMMKMAEKYMQRDMSDDPQDNSQGNPVSPKQQSKSGIEESISKQEDFVLNANISDKEKLSKSLKIDDSSTENRALLQEVPFIHMPYPAFRANFLNLQLPEVLPRYHVPSNVIQSQYYPHNPYAHLQFPLHDFDPYNPSVPLFYQAPIIANQFPVDNLSHTSTTIKDTMSVKASVTESSRTSATKSAGSIESNMVESRSSFESMANKAKEASSSKPALTTSKFMTTSKEFNEETTTESAKPAVKSRKCGDQIVKNKVSNTESTNIEVNSSTEEPNTETSVVSTTEM